MVGNDSLKHAVHNLLKCSIRVENVCCDLWQDTFTTSENMNGCEVYIASAKKGHTTHASNCTIRIQYISDIEIQYFSWYWNSIFSDIDIQYFSDIDMGKVVTISGLVDCAHSAISHCSTSGRYYIKRFWQPCSQARATLTRSYFCPASLPWREPWQNWVGYSSSLNCWYTLAMSSWQLCALQWTEQVSVASPE